MAAKVGEEVVKVPDRLVVWVYAGCPDMVLMVMSTTHWCSWTSLRVSCVCSSTNPRQFTKVLPGCSLSSSSIVTSTVVSPVDLFCTYRPVSLILFIPQDHAVLLVDQHRSPAIRPHHQLDDHQHVLLRQALVHVVVVQLVHAALE